MTTIEVHANGTLASVETCPTCKLAIHVRSWDYGIVIEGGFGTLTYHGHVICPCGWWTELNEVADDPMKVANEHALTHGGDDTVTGGTD